MGLFFFIFLLFSSCKTTFAFDCENRNVACPKNIYPTCKIVGQCNPPNCLVGMVLVEGDWKLYCAEPEFVPTSTPTPPIPTTKCPVCPRGYYWHSAYSLCCKNEDSECRTTNPASFESCKTGQVCQQGVGCVAANPTPSEICGYPSFPGKEQCCYNPSHVPKYYCFEGSPDKQAGGCLCYSRSFVENICKNQSRKCDECVKGGNVWTAIGCIPVNNLNSFVGWLLGRLIFIASGIAFLLMAVGAFQILTSAGTPEKVKAGKELITSALTGLIFIILSMFILSLIGVDILHLPEFAN